MAAGLGFKTFTTGEVLTAADVNGYLMQGILVFASEAARNSAITSPQEGQFAFTKDNNSLWYYTGSAWAASGATGDIEGVTAGVGISGGGTSGTVTITNSMATAIDAKADLIVGTGADTFDRLPVGTNNQTIIADNSTTTGLKYAASLQSTITTTGDIIYGSAANTPARLGIGSTNQVLTVSGGVPTWSTPASGGGFTLLFTSTPSGVSGIDYSSISSSYKHLLLIWNGMYTSDNSTGFDIRFNDDSGSNYSVNDVSGATSVGDSPYLFMEGNSTSTNSGHGYLYIYDYASSSYWKTYNGQSAYYDGDFGWRAAVDKRGMWRSTSAINKVSVVRRAGSGTLSADTGGNVKLYGIA